MSKKYRYNEGIRVEDSTKGRSDLNPKNYKGDVFVQVWLDSRRLATLLVGLEQSGFYPRFMSEVVREGLYALVENLVENKVVEMVDDTREARAMLEGRFKISLNSGGRGLKNVMHNLILSDRRKKVNHSDVGRPMNVDEETRKQVEKEVEIYHQLEERDWKEDIERQKREAIKNAREQGKLVDPEVESAQPAESKTVAAVVTVAVDNTEEEIPPSNPEERERYFARKLEQTAEEDRKLAEMDLSRPVFDEEDG